MELLITVLLAPYFIYKLEKFDAKQQKIIEDVEMIKRHVPKRSDDML